MNDTAFRFDETKHDRFATQYNYDVATRSAVEIPYNNCELRFGTEYDSGGAGLVSTVSDYILLADALANGGVGKNGNRILSSAGVRLMSANSLNEKQLQTFATDFNSGYGYGYGVRANLEPTPSGNLAPVGEFGWDGAANSFCLIDPAERVSVMLGMNVRQFAYGYHVIHPKLRDLVYECLSAK